MKKEIDTARDTCYANTCVQRLWCTDSGVVGRYTIDREQNYYGMNMVLSYAWLRDTSVNDSRVLAATGKENKDTTLMEWTNQYGPGTVLVAGDTLYYYTYDWQRRQNRVYGLPRLSSLVFSEYRGGKSADELVSTGLDALNILGASDDFYWDSYWSPIYPTGKSSLTVSIQDWSNSGETDVFHGNWAIDVALTVVKSGAGIERGAFVHYLYKDAPSLRSTSREILTTPQYSCRAFVDGDAPLCYTIKKGKHYTWDSSEAELFDMTFKPFSSEKCFSLPDTLWLFAAGNHKGMTFNALATYGLGSIVAFSEHGFHGVESHADDACATGRRLVYVTRKVPNMAVVAETPLACEWRQVTPGAHVFEVSYVHTLVKWLGPWQDDFTLLAATDVASHEY